MAEQIIKSKRVYWQLFPVAGVVIFITCVASACNSPISDADALLDENISITGANAPLDEITVTENPKMPETVVLQTLMWSVNQRWSRKMSLWSGQILP